MSLDPSPHRPLPLLLRLTGLWLLWGAWCSLAGWGLSAVHQLGGAGHLVLLPVLLAAGFWWWRATGPEAQPVARPAQWSRRILRPLPFIYCSIAALSLLGALLNAHPWSVDAAAYRLPRILYWWSAHHWYWIGTVDHRLDYSSTGFEWQMLPIVELTHSDRLLFLLNWLPFLLLPGLVFRAFRAFGINGRSSRRWMWLLPSGYCFALQCGGLQNDGYTVNYLLAAIAFTDAAFRSRRAGGFWLALVAAGLLTGAKLSNLPLLLPLGVLWLPLLRRVAWCNWRLAAVGGVAVCCSFIPLALLSWQHTGDWTGDPDDQWHVKAHHAPGALLVNLLVLGRDVTQPPLFPGSDHLNTLLAPVNRSPFMHWLEQSHGDFVGLHYGAMPYEASAGPGFGLGLYLLVLVGGCWFLRPAPRPGAAMGDPGAWAWRLAPWLAWVAYGVLLVKLGSQHSPRIAASYYPLLLVPLLRFPRVAAWERKQFTGVLAGAAAATVIPIILLTPVRPLAPVEAIAAAINRPALNRVAAEYRFWGYLRDELGPLREQLPPNVTRVGFCGGMFDGAYGLWQPLGSRVVVEIGLPPGPHAALPPPDLEYAVVTARGLAERYGLGLTEWLSAAHGEVVFDYLHNVALEAHVPPQFESWYLVKLNPSTTNQTDLSHEPTR